ncbi:DUF3035 domain-containing protein [Aliiruegeria sabulilitoris]|uniref:DUF3035 domain-containing protein n=1 Tax=Aliiruegeria sabulilitoris TaxID=1510458 RepID=UPI00082D85FB|nr:DUF3035 domain-containing protein [Aliiruegeria sabulilitoris]NDR55614.1 DUF3035 domain-containing protein [Pseudoruegeria sp. M32A2M]
MRVASVARAGGLLALCVLAAGCSRDVSQMMYPQRGQVTPDEFAILPSKPMEMPEDLTALPPPAPLEGNRTDVNPKAEAVAALGGNPNRVETDGKLGSDGALISQATRYGVSPEIRKELAIADLEYRKKNRGRLLERWLNVPTYYSAYEQQEMDQHGVLWRYRSKGVPTSAAPPDPEVEE